MVLDIEEELNIYNLELYGQTTITRIHLEFEGIYLSRIVLEHEDYDNRIEYRHVIYIGNGCVSNWSSCKIYVLRGYRDAKKEIKIEKEHYADMTDKVANTLLDLIQNIIKQLR